MKTGTQKRTLALALLAALAVILVLCVVSSLGRSDSMLQPETTPMSLSEAHAKDVELGKASARDAGIDLPEVTWQDIESKREAADENYPEVYWVTDGVLYVKVNGEEETLTPSEAITKYGENSDFVTEYAYLMR